MPPGRGARAGRIRRGTALPRLVAALVLAIPCGAAAQGRVSTPDLTCTQARGLVLRRGAAVLGTGGQTYDRFVRDRSFCESTEIGRRAFVPTRDTPHCLIGYTCYEPGRNDRFGGFLGSKINQLDHVGVSLRALAVIHTALRQV